MNTPRWINVPGAIWAQDWSPSAIGRHVEGITSWAKRPDTMKVLALNKVYQDGRSPVLVPENRYGEYLYDPTLMTERSLWFTNPDSNSAVVVEVGHVHYYFDPTKVGAKVMELLKEMGAWVNRAWRPVVTIPWQELGISPTNDMMQEGPYMQLTSVDFSNPQLKARRGIDAYIEIGVWLDPLWEDCFHMVPTWVDASMKWLMKKMP